MDTKATGYTTHVLSILITPPQNWNAALANAVCGAFAPSDAVYIKSLPVTDVQGTIIGIQKVYRSASLSKQLGVNAFVDSNLNPLPLGTFDIELNYDGGASKVLGCSIAAGIQG